MKKARLLAAILMGVSAATHLVQLIIMNFQADVLMSDPTWFSVLNVGIDLVVVPSCIYLIVKLRTQNIERRI